MVRPVQKEREIDDCMVKFPWVDFCIFLRECKRSGIYWDAFFRDNMGSNCFLATFLYVCLFNEVLMLVNFNYREKDLDEVLQSQIVYNNVSKGVLVKSKDLKVAFGTDDQSKVCLEILEKGELQVAGKERESQLSSQFRDIATIVMQKTFNPETQRSYTISMIERLMHDIHFAIDPNSSSKKQALEVIRELQKHFPIKRSPMRL
ncbi:hypothetical protein ACS0TY_027584 [Phlomoides rotata]